MAASPEGRPIILVEMVVGIPGSSPVETEMAHAQRDVQINDLVLLKEDGHPPIHWPLARITEVHHGLDGHVRAMTLGTASTQLKRPIAKICVLPFEGTFTGSH